MTERSETGELRRKIGELEGELSDRTDELAESQQRYRRIFERSKDVIIVSTPVGRLIDINPAGLELYGYESVEEMKPLDLRTAIWANPRDRDEYVAHLQEFGYVQHFEAKHKRRDGGLLSLVGTTSIVTNRKGEIVELLTILRDISEQKRLQRELERLARSDSLTGLANRFVFLERLEAAVNSARRRSDAGGSFAVIMLDLDNLKEINDSYGHPAGDQALIAVSERFREIVGEDDVLARYGGDEFAVLTFDAGSEEAVLNTARRLVESLAKPIDIADSELVTSVSVGVALDSGEGRSTERMLQRADRALYRAKGRGRNQYSL